MNLPNLVQRTIHPELDALRDLQVPGAAPRPAGKHAFKLDVNSEVQRVGMVSAARVESLQKPKLIRAILRHSDISVTLDFYLGTPKRKHDAKPWTSCRP